MFFQWLKNYLIDNHLNFQNLGIFFFNPNHYSSLVWQWLNTLVFNWYFILLYSPLIWFVLNLEHLHICIIQKKKKPR